MDKTQIQAYSIDFTAANYDTQGLPPGVKLSHTFVASPNYDWNCFGRGKGAVSTATLVKSGTASVYEEWANNIYGPYSGEAYEDQSHSAAGLRVRVEGVCHNAANRILVLGDADVSDATGNALVILMYGKYGFGVTDYVQLVKDAASKVNLGAPSPIIADAEINVVISRILGDQSLESDTLEKDLMRTHFEQQLNLQSLTQDQINGVHQIYSAFEVTREQTYENTLAQNPDISSLQTRYATAMKPVLLDCLGKMMTALGESQYMAMFEADPEVATKFLLGA